MSQPTHQGKNIANFKQNYAQKTVYWFYNDLLMFFSLRVHLDFRDFAPKKVL